MNINEQKEIIKKYTDQLGLNFHDMLKKITFENDDMAMEDLINISLSVLTSFSANLLIYLQKTSNDQIDMNKALSFMNQSLKLQLLDSN